eukprot:266963-Prorocentrum_minimum.AAC.3
MLDSPCFAESSVRSMYSCCVSSRDALLSITSSSFCSSITERTEALFSNAGHCGRWNSVRLVRLGTFAPAQ